MKFKVLLMFTLIFSVFIFTVNCSKDDKEKVEICNNGIDDDGDGFIDGNDFDCVEVGDKCNDGIDNDGDGFIDGDDFDCDESLNCNDGVDNDGDGFVDCDDFDCNGNTDCP